MMMTTFNNIPLEIYSIIAANLTTLEDQISARQVNLGFYNNIKNFSINKSLMEMKLGEVHLGLNRINNNLCINGSCGSRCQVVGRVEDVVMGCTMFYYPEELLEAHDYEGDPYGPNFEYRHRMRACQNAVENGRFVKRYIPYCENCMLKCVNFGSRDDGLQVPYNNFKGYDNL